MMYKKGKVGINNCFVMKFIPCLRLHPQPERLRGCLGRCHPRLHRLIHASAHRLIRRVFGPETDGNCVQGYMKKLLNQYEIVIPDW